MYNDAACELIPPRPTVDWTAVTKYNFIQEFALLADTRQDSRDKPWTKPEARQALRLHRRIKQSRTELIRCNVQVRRMHTSIHDEDISFDKVLKELQAKLDPIRGAVEHFITYRRRMNMVALKWVYWIHRIEGFSGSKTVGCRKGGVSHGVSERILEDSWTEEGVEADDDDDAIDEENVHNICDVVNYIANISDVA